MIKYFTPWVAESEFFLGGIGFLTTSGVGVEFFCRNPTPEVRLYHFSHHTPKLGIFVEMAQFLSKLEPPIETFLATVLVQILTSFRATVSLRSILRNLKK